MRTLPYRSKCWASQAQPQPTLAQRTALKQKLNLIVPQDGAALDRLLAQFSFWYNTIRPHQHLHGLTPMEAWRGIDPYQTAPSAVVRYEAWGGLLKGLRMLR